MLRLLINIIPQFIYLLIIIFIINFRYQLDKEGVFIGSDGAIKLYQTVQYKESGLLSLECPYPGKEFDSDFKHFPISYPWAIFNVKNIKCVLEYPPFFYWLGALLLRFLPLSLLMYLPLLFYSANIFIFDFILRKIGLNSVYRVLLTILGFISFSLLTALDYTENPAFQTFYLLGFYYFLKLNQDKDKTIKSLLFTGILFGFAFVLRLEILMTFSFLCLVYFLFTRDFKNPFFIYIGFALIGFGFVFYNIQTSGHPLGFRYVSSIDFNENAKADFWKRLILLRAYIWGDEVMVGLFKFHPLCWLIVLLPVYAWLNKICLINGNIFLTTGWVSIFAIPFYVTFYGGVGYFGLRYLEAPFFLLLIGIAIYLSQEHFTKPSPHKWIILLLLVFVGYGNWLSTREGLKVLRNSSQANVTLQSFLSKSDRFIIHSSLYTSILMGRSFIEKTHVNLIGNEEVMEYLKNISNKERFIFLLSPEKIYISSDIPKKMYSRYKTQISMDLLPVEVTEETTINGVRLVLAKRK